MRDSFKKLARLFACQGCSCPFPVLQKETEHKDSKQNLPTQALTELKVLAVILPGSLNQGVLFITSVCNLSHQD